MQNVNDSKSIIRLVTVCWMGLGFLPGVPRVHAEAAADEAVDPAGNPAAVEAREDYQLVWSDEFTVAGAPDPKKWTFERGFVRNQELQWYQPENARSTDGVLVIESRRESVANSRYDASSRDWRTSRQQAAYTSACLTTQGRFEWLYGRTEVRARIDARVGLWPAIWTLGVSQRWPACGEVDIMEYYAHSLLANACWQDSRRRGPAWDSTQRPMADFGGPEWASEFHVWKMDWDAHGLRLSVDGKHLNSINSDEVVVRNGRPHPFRQPHYLLLNLAIGGTNGGDPQGTDFPARFEVDYVRVYQHPSDRVDLP